MTISENCKNESISSKIALKFLTAIFYLFVSKFCFNLLIDVQNFLKIALAKNADGADGPIVHFYKFFWPQKCVMRS